MKKNQRRRGPLFPPRPSPCLFFCPFAPLSRYKVNKRWYLPTNPLPPLFSSSILLSVLLSFPSPPPRGSSAPGQSCLLRPPLSSSSIVLDLSIPTFFLHFLSLLLPHYPTGAISLFLLESEKSFPSLPSGAFSSEERRPPLSASYFDGGGGEKAKGRVSFSLFPYEGLSFPSTPPGNGGENVETFLKDKRRPWKTYFPFSVVTFEMPAKGEGRADVMHFKEGDQVSFSTSSTFDPRVSIFLFQQGQPHPALHRVRAAQVRRPHPGQRGQQHAPGHAGGHPVQARRPPYVKAQRGDLTHGRRRTRGHSHSTLSGRGTLIFHAVQGCQLTRRNPKCLCASSFVSPPSVSEEEEKENSHNHPCFQYCDTNILEDLFLLLQQKTFLPPSLA